MGGRTWSRVLGEEKKNGRRLNFNTSYICPVPNFLAFGAFSRDSPQMGTSQRAVIEF